MTLVLDSTDQSTDARHPLAPLTAAEMAEGCRIVKTSGAVDPAVRIVYCTLAEPPKEAVLGWDGSALDRRVIVRGVRPSPPVSRSWSPPRSRPARWSKSSTVRARNPRS